MHETTSRRGAFNLIRLLLVALALSLSTTCTCGFIPGNPVFCNLYCSKCQNCYDSDDSWSEDDCEWMVDSGAFDRDDCMEGCSAGELPGHPMPPSWEGWSCEAFDEFL